MRQVNANIQYVLTVKIKLTTDSIFLSPSYFFRTHFYISYQGFSMTAFINVAVVPAMRLIPSTVMIQTLIVSVRQWTPLWFIIGRTAENSLM